VKKKDLYRIVANDTVYTYTSADAPEVYEGETYVPSSIGRNEIQTKSQITKTNCDISVPLDHPIALIAFQNNIESIMSLTIFTDEDGTVEIEWKGRLASVKPNATDLTMTFESIFSSLKFPGLRGCYQLNCRYVLYGRGCKLNKVDFAHNGHVTGIDPTGTLLQIPEAASFPNGTFTAGMVEYPMGVMRFVINHTGNQLMLIRTMDTVAKDFPNSGYGRNYGGLYGGIYIIFYPGCDRGTEICDTRFNNLPNHGGFPFIPFNSPIGGSKIA